MQRDEYYNIFQNENTHFYYRAVHKLVLDLIQRYKTGNKKLSFLDVGCGTGLLGTKLKTFGNVVGLDIHPEAIRFAKQRGLRAVCGDAAQLPFSDTSFDFVVCIDVLYHQRIRDDRRVILECFRVLKPGGILIVRTPALSWLTTPHDRVVQTRHRYDKKELEILLSNAEFLVEKLTYAHFLLLPAVWIHSVLCPNNKASSVFKVHGLINEMMFMFLSLEIYVLRYITMPLGLGLLAVARKGVLQK